MNPLPPVPRFAPALSQALRQALRLGASSVLALLIAAGVLLAGATVHAQSGWPRMTELPSKDNDATPEKTVQRGPRFTLTNGSGRFSMPAEHSSGAGAIKTTSIDGYDGTIDYKCSLETKTDSKTPPLCGMYPGTLTIKANHVVDVEMLVFGKGTNLPPGVSTGKNVPPLGKVLGAGGVVLACGLLFAIPARRRAWRAMLSAILLLFSVAGFTACDNSYKMITYGSYTFFVTGTDSQNPALTETVKYIVEVL
jgi:trimeric autotransporter adhesin